MYGNQVQPTTQVPNFGLSDTDHQFVAGAAQQHAGDIKAMLPDAFAVVKFAAAILGVLAVGCSVLESQKPETKNRFGIN